MIILLIIIICIIPSLSRGLKSFVKVENEVSLPTLGSPTFAHNLQFAIEQSVHPVPIA